ncbi:MULTISPECIES: T9SS sorting signal type C domain-containing protein [Flavobacterium]|uniref:T9SS sorting signal type C domain-containing protein n=1 Tax=Flavobacterium TaxID=237 RepID=UPI00118280B2|nr:MULTISPECIES: T9SS sorting signal type C domain-containing protein [Flavobacterium]MCR4032112.1 T9SS sorting signal type C domain-containing protein [Flavobacterium panacis]
MKKLFLSSLLLAAQYAVSINSDPFLHGPSTYINVPGESIAEKDEPQSERHRVWLNLTSTEGIFKQLLIGYITGATNGWDVNYDAVSLDANRYADFYSISEGKKLVIQGRPAPIDPSDTVVLGYRSAVKGNLTISIDHADGDLSQKDIYLYDKAAGKLHNLREGGYTFNTDTGIFNDRFILRYASERTLGTNKVENNPVMLYVVVQDKVISLISLNTVVKQSAVFDAAGRLLYSCQNTDASSFQISGIQASSQMLLVKATLEDGRTITRKVIF